MLFMSPGQNNINRLQSPWISDEDVSELINFIKEQSWVQYDNNFIEKMKEIKENLGG